MNATTTTLTPVQEHVVALLAGGTGIADAAKACDIHRTTIHHWKRENPDFANALADAYTDFGDLWRSIARKHAAAALDTLTELMNDPETSPSIRLKAALYILTEATSTPGEKAKTRRPLIAMPAAPPVPAPANAEAAANTADPEIILNYSSQFNTSDATDVKPYVRPTPKIGRNEQCPCGSNRKFKQCCLNKKAIAA